MEPYEDMLQSQPLLQSTVLGVLQTLVGKALPK